MNTGDESGLNEKSDGETAAKKVKQETNGDGLPLDAPSRLLQEQNNPVVIQEDAANQHLPQPPIHPLNYPMQPHVAYNPLGPFMSSPPHQFPFIPPPQPAAHYHHHPPQNVPFQPNPPPFHLPQPQYPSPTVSMQYYEARMRDHAAA